MSTPEKFDVGPANSAFPTQGLLTHPLPAGMRDLLPSEAESQSRLSGELLRTFDLFGYQRVSLPAFEYAEVLERGLGAIEPTSVVRFVEPDSGEVVALRPDVTPQVARLVSTRLSQHPSPARLSYRGSVVRRQRERARHDQQIMQAGIELVGAAGPAADLEVLEVTTTALRQAGLVDFAVDLGHGAIALSLLSDTDPTARGPLLEALSLKDAAEISRRARSLGVSEAIQKALLGLLELQGDLGVFEDARAVLRETAAWPHVLGLEELARAVAAAGLAPRLVVDLGETRAVAYYTGAMFQILAEGPGQAVASGGRYDALYGRFGADRLAAGAAVHVDHLRWALGTRPGERRVRALVTRGTNGAATREVLASLRAAGISCASFEGEGALDYAAAWGYSHVAAPVAVDGRVMVDVVAVGQTPERRLSLDQVTSLRG